jgi:hypothetical protein
MTEEKKEMTNEEPIILTFDDVPYRASDLNEEQLPIAVELNEIVPQLQRLEREHLKLNRFKNYLVQDFKRSLEVETPEDTQTEESE